MSKNANQPDTRYLDELRLPTPSGVAKLLAAWDDLDLENQVMLLAEKTGQKLPSWLFKQIIEKAISSPNAFLRYKAARESKYIRDEAWQKKIEEALESDPEPLVKYARLEDTFIFEPPEYPEKFFSLPQAARLATVRELTGCEEVVADLIEYAVDQGLENNRVSEGELYEILSDYLDKPHFREPRYVDGWDALLSGKGLDRLWELVTKVPEGLSTVLVDHLPGNVGDFWQIPAHVLEGMSNRQLTQLFWRPDIELREIRKQKFFQFAGLEKDDAGEKTWFILGAAGSHSFDLTNEEFSDILAKPQAQRARILNDICRNAQDLRLCMFEAVQDALRVCEEEPSETRYENREMLSWSFERKLNALKGKQREEELEELRLYMLATYAVPWREKSEKMALQEELAFLQEVIIEDDTWATFIAFSKIWSEKPRYETSKLVKHLPGAWWVEESALSTDDLEGLAPNQKVEEVMKPITLANEQTPELLNTLPSELAELRDSIRYQQRLYWIVIGLLVMLLILAL